MDLALDKKKTALVVIDLQKGIVGMPAQPHSTSEVVANAAKLADAFRKNGMKVFLVHVMGSQEERPKPVADNQPFSSSAQAQMPKDWAEIVPELGPKEGDIVITKRQWGAFYGTDLEMHLRRRGIETIVLCGIATSIGVESTARFAYEYNYNMVFAEDAMSDRSAEMHERATNSIFRSIGRVRKTDEIIAALGDAR